MSDRLNPADPSAVSATKGAERERAAHSIWAELHDASRLQNEKTQRLKALRLARQAGSHP